MSMYFTSEIATILAFFTIVVNSVTYARTLSPVHWNASNPMFKASSEQPIIMVNIDDQIDFVCPYYSGNSATDDHEYYAIYKVSKKSYEDCQLDMERVLIVNCSEPSGGRQKKFTLTITRFTPIPNTPEFSEGETHYFTTTSTGMKHGLANQFEGACLHYNMKLSLKVCCDESSPTSTSTTTSRAITTTTRASTSTRRRRRSTTTTENPWIKVETTKKSSDNDIDNDTDPESGSQTGSSISLHSSSSKHYFYIYISLGIILLMHMDVMALLNQRER